MLYERMSMHVKDELEGMAFRPIIAEIMDSRFDPGFRLSTAAHDIWHLWYVLENEAVVWLYDVEHAAKEGHAFLIPGGATHGLIVPISRPCRVFDVKFAPGSSQARQVHGGVMEDRFGIRHLIDRVLNELDRKAPAWETVVCGLFDEVLGEVARRLHGPDLAAIPHRASYCSLVWQAAAFIEANFTRPLGLDDVAGQVALSPKYLSLIFRKTTGFTVREFITNVRIEKAKQMLARQDMPVKEVAQRVGYDSIYHFSRVFRTTVGVPPTVFRQTHNTHYHSYNAE